MREDSYTNLRGLYASKDILDSDTPLLSIPNKLIVSSLHIKDRLISNNHASKTTYGQFFSAFPLIFDPDYPAEPSLEFPGKMTNNWAEYFQITFFLVIERFKQDKSFYKPFIDSLPEHIENFCTLDHSTKISHDEGSPSLLSEVQSAEDLNSDLRSFKQENMKNCQKMFGEAVTAKFAELQEWLGADGLELEREQ